MTEYIILFILYWLVPMVMNYYILPPEDLLMMSTFKGIVIPYVIIAILIIILTIILNMIRSIRTCSPRSWGLLGGIKLSIFASFSAIIMNLITDMLPVLISPFIAISILPYSTQIGKGFYVALGAFMGYWVGRSFISLCQN